MILSDIRSGIYIYQRPYWFVEEYLIGYYNSVTHMYSVIYSSSLIYRESDELDFADAIEYTIHDSLKQYFFYSNDIGV